MAKHILCKQSMFTNISYILRISISYAWQNIAYVNLYYYYHSISFILDQYVTVGQIQLSGVRRSKFGSERPFWRDPMSIRVFIRVQVYGSDTIVEKGLKINSFSASGCLRGLGCSVFLTRNPNFEFHPYPKLEALVSDV